LVVGVHDVITPFKFGDDRFRGFGLAEGQSLHFPKDFEGRPYNTHIQHLQHWHIFDRSPPWTVLAGIRTTTKIMVIGTG